MLAALPQHSMLYASTFGTDVKQLEEIVKHGSNLDSNNNNDTTIPGCTNASMWFSTPDCAQLAADTYQRPVCVYSDNPSIPSASFLPFCLPKTKQSNKQPLILNHVNNNHWTTVDLSRNASRKWPTISELFFLGCHRNNIPDNFDNYWNKYKEFNKHDRRNAMLSLAPCSEETIDLTNIN
ncbi:hypothetical protein CLU79DRAFT_746177 [Phycomyces nitens]|nr:hypothetical protein CLU79DRAFT_746177 [Phycomyces nitens]